jgi:COMM domain
VPFLSKYGGSLGVGAVVPLRDFLIQVIQVGLRKSPPTSTLDFVKEGLTQFINDQEIPGIDAKFIDILSICVFSRREELRKVLTELVLQQAVDKHLVDYNYNVELCLSSDTMMKVNESMLVLELFLRGSDGKHLERIIIEMNRQEAKAFVAKLKEIEKEVIAGNSLQA